MEALTSRPLWLAHIAEKTRQERLTLTPIHGHGEQAKAHLLRVSARLNTWHRAAEQSKLRTVWQSVCDHLVSVLTGYNGRISALSPPDPPEIAMT